MTLETFLTRLEAGKANNLLYSVDGREGLATAWKHQDTYVLTCEECPAGGQFDESTYTRDERHRFLTVAGLLEFLASEGWKVESFAP
ncbi:hypothetical protein [Paludisphaera mucosa]|uniref:Uncharacterized protein n=1 Tax=Paludisphaera mucosa TaxID=3030827 RepID=A0ABT6FHZ0_9BACT|nr:hypothetical protein [Paludisphaera mucosa]MDG3007185.1 hypothetical protein [Paludisphaera mucosa]